MSTVHSDAERQERLLVFTKGAPDVLLARCSRRAGGRGRSGPLTQERRAEILEEERRTRRRGAAHARGRLPLAAEGCARQSRRLIERVEQELVFLGLIGMIDPPREEAKDAVARAQGRGHPPDA